MILAAGQSSRLGRPKQLLTIHHESLVARMLRLSSKLGLSKIYVITGAYRERIEEEILKNGNIQVVFNQNYKSGMASSIACGTEYALKDNLDAIIITVVDQVFLQKDHLQELMESYQDHNSIAISKYDEGAGPPSLFGRAYFNELASSTGEQGAKSIIKKHKSQVIYIPFPKGNNDIDSPEDLHYLNDA